MKRDEEIIIYGVILVLVSLVAGFFTGRLFSETKTVEVEKVVEASNTNEVRELIEIDKQKEEGLVEIVRIATETLDSTFTLNFDKRDTNIATYNLVIVRMQKLEQQKQELIQEIIK